MTAWQCGGAGSARPPISWCPRGNLNSLSWAIAHDRLTLIRAAGRGFDSRHVPVGVLAKCRHPCWRNAWAAADSGGPGIRRLRALSAEERVGAESIPMTCRRALGARRRYCRPLLFIASAMRSDRQGDLSSDCRGTGTRSNAHGRLGRGRGRRRSRQTSPVDSVARQTSWQGPLLAGLTWQGV
jgi:hypothetical protein